LEPKHWLPILSLLFVFGMLLRIPLLMAFTVILMVVIGLAHWWRQHALDGVTYRRQPHYRRSFPGETVELRLEVENRKLLPISWLRVLDNWPEAVGPQEDGILAPSHLPGQGLLTNIFSLRWFERARRSYTLLFRQRGVYPVGPARLESGDLFGLYEISQEQANSELLTVFPALVPFGNLRLAGACTKTPTSRSVCATTIPKTASAGCTGPPPLTPGSSR
jgi:uncharacterized protein (DUF58 family)